MDGEQVPRPEKMLRLGLERGWLELCLIGGCPYSAAPGLPFPPPGESEARTEDSVLGYDLLSTWKGYLQGHQVWIRPERRGQGLLRGYFSAILQEACRRGLNGFFFWSTLPFWVEAAPRMGFEQRAKVPLPHGELRAYFKEV